MQKIMKFFLIVLTFFSVALNASEPNVANLPPEAQEQAQAMISLFRRFDENAKNMCRTYELRPEQMETLIDKEAIGQKIASSLQTKVLAGMPMDVALDEILNEVNVSLLEKVHAYKRAQYAGAGGTVPAPKSSDVTVQSRAALNSRPLILADDTDAELDAAIDQVVQLAGASVRFHLTTEQHRQNIRMGLMSIRGAGSTLDQAKAEVIARLKRELTTRAELAAMDDSMRAAAGLPKTEKPDRAIPRRQVPASYWLSPRVTLALAAVAVVGLYWWRSGQKNSGKQKANKIAH